MCGFSVIIFSEINVCARIFCMGYICMFKCMNVRTLYAMSEYLYSYLLVLPYSLSTQEF
jgi:hypothetical protein